MKLLLMWMNRLFKTLNTKRLVMDGKYFFGLCFILTFVFACHKSPENQFNPNTTKSAATKTVKPGQFVPIDRSVFSQNLRAGVFFVYPDNRDSVYSEMQVRNKQSGILAPLLADSSGNGFFEGNIYVRYAEYYIDEINPRPKPDIYSLRTLKTEIWSMALPDSLNENAPGNVTKLFMDEVIKKVRPSSCYQNEISYENIRFTIRLIDSSVACNFTGETGKQTKTSALIKMHHIKYADHFIAYSVLGEELPELAPPAVEDAVRAKLHEMSEWNIRPIMETLHGAGRISGELTMYGKDCLE